MTTQSPENDSATSASIDTVLTRQRSRPVRPEFEVIDIGGNVVWGPGTTTEAVEWAEANLSGEQNTAQPLQPPDGWDIQQVGGHGL